jgi:hypothetical protein
MILWADRRAGYNHQAEGRKSVLMAISEDCRKWVLEKLHTSYFNQRLVVKLASIVRQGVVELFLEDYHDYDTVQS